MRLKKTMAAVVASCMMTMSAASLVKNITAFSSEVPTSPTVCAIESIVELDGLTDDYLKKIPLKIILDNMTYAQDVFGEEDSDESSGAEPSESGGENAESGENENSTLVSESENPPVSDLEEDTSDSAIESEPVVDGGFDESFDQNASDAEIAVGVGEVSEDIPEPVHKVGDKVELDNEAKYIWIGEERFSLSDEKAVLNLFIEGSENEYTVEKEIAVGSSEERFDSRNSFYNVKFVISKNCWSFDSFEFYTINEKEEKAVLESKVKEIGFKSCEFIINSPLEQGKNIYLSAVPRFIKDGEICEDVDIQVEYHGENVKNNCILTDGKITIDFRAVDKENGNTIKGQKDFTISISEKSDSEDNTSESDTSEDNSSEGDTSEDNSSEGDTSEDNSSEGDTSEGNSSEGDTSEDNSSEGNTSEDNSSEGDTSEDNSSEDNSSEGDTSEDNSSEGDTSDGNNSEVTSLPNESEPTQAPNETTPPIEEIPLVELSADCGSAIELLFDNISGDKFEINVTGGSLEGLNVNLSESENVIVGSCEIDDGKAKIVLSPIKDVNGDIPFGNISGKLIITANNAQPLEIELSGHSGFARIIERNSAQTKMRYMPYSTEYALDRDYPWLSAEFTLIGELPDGLEFDAESGKISGAPTVAGTFTFEIAANLTYKDKEQSDTVQITREVEFNILNSTAKNVYMITDPDYGIALPLGEHIDGRAFYIDTDEVMQELSVTLKGDCSEFYDLWLNGRKLRRSSDDYKNLHGSTLITFESGAFKGLEFNEINTLVFVFKPNGSDKFKYAAQNFIITDDKSAIEPNDEATQDYLNMYTPVNKIVDNGDSKYAETLSSVKIYTKSGNLPSGTKTVVKPNVSASKDGIGMDIRLADEKGNAVQPEKSLTVQVSLPNDYKNGDVYVYELENGNYSKAGSTVKDGKLFFTADESKTFVVSKRALSGNKATGSNPTTGIALSSVGFVASGAALVLILTGKRKK